MKISQHLGRALVGLNLIAAGGASFAYEQPTHVVVSQQAFNESILQLIPFQYDIGAFGINNDFSLGYVKNPDSTGLQSDLYALVQLGAWYEDNGRRPLNHFFNPVNNQPLPSPLGPTSTSPDWALEDNGTISGQNNSFADARQYYWTALTTADPNVRSTNMGLTFQSLGQVIHHIQDMSQPQHARDEAHCNAYWGCFVPGVLFSYFHPSLYEGYLLKCTTTTPDPSLNCPPVYGAASYAAAFDQANAAGGTPFALPRNFWIGSGQSKGTGIAEYANAGFIGARTNFAGTPLAVLPFDSTTLPQPDGSGTKLTSVLLSDSSLYGSAVPPGPATMAFITRPVKDVLQASTADAVRTSTVSVFASDLSQLNQPGLFAYNRFVASAAASLLIPRAIGYSAGLLNYFFRGKIGVTLPHEGVYGITDHSAQYGSNSSTNPASQTQGFRTIKMALTNASPDGEAMSNGTLAAIVRFRRNLQFTDTLDNEPGSPSINSLTAVRGAADEIIVATDVFDGGGNLLSPGSVSLTSTPQEFSFQFTTALLPLNSVDVRVEIVWQGTMGAEQNTAVVTTGFDISEPSYLAFFNAFDYISIGGKIVTRDELNADQSLLALVQPTSCVVGTPPNLALQASCFLANTTLLVSLDSNNAAASAANLIYLQNLPAQDYIRVAILTDALSASVTTNLLNSSPCNIGDSSIAVAGLNNEISIQSVNYTSTPPTVNETINVGDLSALRGINGWENISCVWDGDGSGKVTGDISVMTKLTQNAIYPQQVQVNFPQNQ
jgi:hypothetical protein